MTIKQAMEKAIVNFKLEKIESPILKARMLMQYVLKKPREYIMIYDSKKLTPKQEEQYIKGMNDIQKGTPIEHITHQKEFMKLNFYVDENVLIPRQDTETLVEEVIKLASKPRINNKNAKFVPELQAKFLDLCTGSGAIAVSLAKYIENCEVTATDISPQAIEIAKTNAKNNQVENKITFIESDLFKSIAEEKYDIIVSNPPYIKQEVLKTLDKEVQKEPRLALDGGKDGLDFYRKIIKEAYKYLKYEGYLCLEIGYDQKEDVIQLIKKEGKYINTYCVKDLCDKDRVIVTKVGG